MVLAPIVDGASKVVVAFVVTFFVAPAAVGAGEGEGEGEGEGDGDDNGWARGS